MAVGVLALQGSFNEHIAALKRLGVKGVEIRKPDQLQSIRALIIPGGESTTMAKLAEYHNLFPALRDFVKMGKPVWGTCAGLIFLADKAVGQKIGGQELVGGLNCTVHRNFFGSQLQSFETEISVPEIVAKEGGVPSFRGVFIRAPGILDVGPEVQVLAEVPAPSDRTAKLDPSSESRKEDAGSEKKVIVAVKQGNLLATAFHPELTADTRWHSYFMKMVNEISQEASSSQEISSNTSLTSKETRKQRNKMSSMSSSSLNSESAHENPMCSCGRRTIIRTAWTDRNPGRRFLCCPHMSCNGYFRFIDPETTDRSKKIISALLKKLNKVRDENRKWKIAFLLLLVLFVVFIYMYVLAGDVAEGTKKKAAVKMLGH